jgi:raffinose/stachyose/melibiose transport system substrate-binding protein
MKKMLLTSAAALMCASATTAIAEDTVVTYRSWSPVVQTLNKMVAATEAANPGIKIEVKTFNYNEYIVDLQTRANSGDLPDIVGLEPGALTQQYRNFLSPVQQCAQTTWGDDWQSKFFPLAIEQARLGNPEGDENFYGLPVLTQTINMWYTVPVLKEMGMEPPTTYDELKTFAEKARSMGFAPIMIGASDGWIRRDVFMQIIHNIAPGLIYKAAAGEASFNDPAFVEAFQVWKNLFDDKIFQVGALGLSHYPGAVEVIESGRAATFPMGAWWNQQAAGENPTPLSKNLSGYAPFKFPDVTGNGAPDDFLGGIDVMIGISTDVDDYDAACKVMTDWIGGAGAQALINTFNDLPAFVGLTPEKFGSENQEAVWNKFTEEMLPTVKYARQLASPAVKQTLEDALAAVAAGDKTPVEGAAMVQAGYDSEQ